MQVTLELPVTNVVTTAEHVELGGLVSFWSITVGARGSSAILVRGIALGACKFLVSSIDGVKIEDLLPEMHLVLYVRH